MEEQKEDAGVEEQKENTRVEELRDIARAEEQREDAGSRRCRGGGAGVEEQKTARGGGAGEISRGKRKNMQKNSGTEDVQ